MFVKICGMTNLESVDAAVAAGADAVGFVFAASPRRLDVVDALELAAAVPEHIVRVAVLRHPTAAEVGEIVERFAPDWLQTDAEDFDAWSLPAHCRGLPVYRNGRVPDTSTLPPRLLFEGRDSGTGATADWNEARELARETELILAGGLRIDNVGAAIAEVAPWGIDVSSGVESERGVKNPRKITEFIARVRALEN